MGLDHAAWGRLTRLGFLSQEATSVRSTQQHAALKDVHGGASKTHFPKASGQPNACRNPRGEVGWAGPAGGVG